MSEITQVQLNTFNQNFYVQELIMDITNDMQQSGGITLKMMSEDDNPLYVLPYQLVDSIADEAVSRYNIRRKSDNEIIKEDIDEEEFRAFISELV